MSALRIESYRFKHLVVDGQVYQRDVIILPDRVMADWRRKSGHSLCPDDLQVVFEAAPAVLVVGQGAFGLLRVTEEARRALEQAGIALVVAPTAKAVKAYNALREERAVAAALHVAC